MNSIVDVFPRYPSESLTKLEKYPEKNFTFWRYKTLSTGEQKQIFVYFMNAHNRVYYLKKQPSEKCDIAVLQIGKGCQKFDRKMFNPSKINFENIKKRLRKDPNDETRSNADTRLGFKIGNEYLVKAFFTSGLRTVERHTAHVIQTLRVPLLLYIFPPKRLKRVSAVEKLFPDDELNQYSLSILPPNSVNRIPPGIKYVLLTVQKTFFTFDVVLDTYKIPFGYRNPVKHKLKKLPGCDYLDKPVATPYIEHVKSDSEEEMGTIDFSQQQQEEPQQQENVQQENVPQQQYTFLLIPPPERNVVQVSLDFAEAYQKFKEKNKIDSKPRLEISKDNNEIEELPLDLSNKSITEETTAEQNIFQDTAEQGIFQDTTTAEYATQSIFQDTTTDNSSDLLQQATQSIFQDNEMLDLDCLMDNYVEPDEISNIESEFFSDLL